MRRNAYPQVFLRAYSMRRLWGHASQSSFEKPTVRLGHVPCSFELNMYVWSMRHGESLPWYCSHTDMVVGVPGPSTERPTGIVRMYGVSWKGEMLMALQNMPRVQIVSKHKTWNCTSMSLWMNRHPGENVQLSCSMLLILVGSVT